jgi:adenylate cyclase
VEEDLDFPVLQEVKALGATDYVALPVRFMGGVTAAATFATDRPGGFSTAHLAALDRLMPYLAMILETQTKSRVLTTLLDTYLGHHAGRRVLAGTIRRGDAHPIHAVLWYCDLRGSTELAQQLEPALLIETLNAFFSAMGDRSKTRAATSSNSSAMPCSPSFRSRSWNICHVKAKRALTAAAEAQARLAALNEARP